MRRVVRKPSLRCAPPSCGKTRFEPAMRQGLDSAWRPTRKASSLLDNRHFAAKCCALFSAASAVLGARDVHLVFLSVDPKWDVFRAEPRFSALLSRCPRTGPLLSDVRRIKVTFRAPQDGGTKPVTGYGRIPGRMSLRQRCYPAMGTASVASLRLLGIAIAPAIILKRTTGRSVVAGTEAAICTPGCAMRASLGWNRWRRQAVL